MQTGNGKIGGLFPARLPSVGASIAPLVPVAKITQHHRNSAPPPSLEKYSPLSPGLPYGGALTTDALSK
jgi:hypothetical protein